MGAGGSRSRRRSGTRRGQIPAHPNPLVGRRDCGRDDHGALRLRLLRREVKYGRNSGVDFLLEQEDRPPCYVEVKNVHLMRTKNTRRIPDAVTARGAKHLDELSAMVTQGCRAVMVYLVQIGSAERVALAPRHRLQVRGRLRSGARGRRGGDCLSLRDI